MTDANVQSGTMMMAIITKCAIHVMAAVSNALIPQHVLHAMAVC